MIRNYRYKHYTIIAIAATILIVTLLPLSTPKFVENIIFFLNIVVIGWLGIGERTEKADELTELNLSKANRYTMFAAMIAILIFSFFGNDDTGKDIVTLPSIVFNTVLCGLVIFRSVVFLCLDRTDGKDGE